MSSSSRSNLDNHQYTVDGLRAYEAIYGRDFVSPGGRATTAVMLTTLDPKPGERFLDVGCGLGGAAFMMAQEFGLTVTGIDQSQNMATEAIKRCQDYGLTDRVTIVHGDVLDLPPGEPFDTVWSREVFLHIHDKRSLFAKLLAVLKPGGTLFFTDYGCGDGPFSEDFVIYTSEFGYHLRTARQTADLLEEAGFVDIEAIDTTAEFIEIHRTELEGLDDAELTTEERVTLRAGWEAKLARAEAGEQRWGRFQARRPS